MLSRSCVVSTLQPVSYYGTTPLWYGPVLKQQEVNLVWEHRVRRTRGQRYASSRPFNEIRITANRFDKQHHLALPPSVAMTRAPESLDRCLSVSPRLTLFRVEELNPPPMTQMLPRAPSRPDPPSLCASMEQSSSDWGLPCVFCPPLSTNSGAVVLSRLQRSARHGNPVASSTRGPCGEILPQATTRKRAVSAAMALSPRPRTRPFVRPLAHRRSTH